MAMMPHMPVQGTEPFRAPSVAAAARRCSPLPTVWASSVPPWRLGVDRPGSRDSPRPDGGEPVPSPWQHDDAENAAYLGRRAAWLRMLHVATATFEPPADATPQRELPMPGSIWTHGDVGYPNVVYRNSQLIGLIDWEFAAPAYPCCDPAALLATGIRGPKPPAEDHGRVRQRPARRSTRSPTDTP